MAKLETLKKILKQSQSDLKLILIDYLAEKSYKPVIGDGFIYAKGDIPILLIAHLDTVHTTPPKQIFYDDDEKIMWSPDGIGGDDRCGIYIICKILEEGYEPHILFLEDEEKGCIGAGKCLQVLKAPKVRYMVEIDRRGSDDCVFYSCDNPKFTEYIESFGFETAIGSCSDISKLSPEWKIASVNVSAGYYNEHTKQEYISISDMEKTYARIMDMLDDTDNTYYEFIQKKYTYTNYQYGKNDTKKLPDTTNKDNKTEDKKKKEDTDKTKKKTEKWGTILDSDAYGFQGADNQWYSWSEYDDYLEMYDLI